MILVQILVLAPFFILSATSQRVRLPNAQYQHEIFYSRSADLNGPGILPLSSQLSRQYNIRAAGNLFALPALHSVNLFTPNTIPQPAETPGQFENYRQALEEEAREAKRTDNSISVQRENGDRRPKMFVSVQVGSGTRQFDYGYII